VVKRFLITTALEETWSDAEPVLFLGEWCRRYSRKHRWSALDAEVLPYHWDDRAQLHADYRYLRGFHERLLQDLTVQLNQIHGVDRSLRYWRILIGPWLGYFVQVLFDRWTSIQQAVSQYDLSGTVVLTSQSGPLVPNDMADFNRLYVGDGWNHECYAMILQQFTTVACTSRMQGPEREPADERKADGWKLRLRRALATTYCWTAGRLSRDCDVFLLHTYLPRRDEMSLYLRLGQVPQLWRSPPVVRVAADKRQRQWHVSGQDRSEFETCARAAIPQQIPTAYLEGYRNLVDQAAGMPWPAQPRLIWTSNAESAVDVFKAWAAEKVERRSPLVIGQHGGHYGMGRWSFLEDHETAISDCFLSWGWAEAGQPQVRPLGQLKAKRPLGIRHAEQPGALLVFNTAPRQSAVMFSAMVSSQWLDYFDDQCAFLEALPPSIRRAMTVRLHVQDDGWDQVARLTERLPDVRLDGGRSSITELVRRSRLYVSTYNGTSYLESFTMDVPTVIFWNPSHWELRDSAVPYFDDLKRVGIFHDNPGSAARHVAAIWDDVDAWWTSPAVREVVERFKARYCRLPDDLLDQVEAALRAVIADRQAGRSTLAATDTTPAKA
jgi:putative transferase (TIGR04331 family)